MRKAFTLLLSGWAFSQLSGIVNGYAAVTAFADPSTVVVDDPTPFQVGDRVMLYQAKGATINTTNSASYGDITAIGGAGLFEFNQIQAISGNQITFNCPRVRPFGNPATDAIQLIRVAYSPGNLTITGTVTALSWDGSKGGLVVIETDGTLSFGANIDVRGQGFKGGLFSINGGSSSACDAANFHGSYDDQAGRKGEGVAAYPAFNHVAYRGKSANGGGGGNNHNCGGGGGANFGGGGQGGWTTCGSRLWCSGWNYANSGWGYGGAALSGYLSATSPRAFFGGGGGGGHHNNDQGGIGGNGGGIVILRAAAMTGYGFQVIAAGDSGYRAPAICGGGATTAGNDGAGGGGAGGSVLLFCDTYLTPLTVDVRGGRGGSCSNYLCACHPDHGPGGGGGGGWVGMSPIGVPTNLSLLLSGGANGIELTPLSNGVPECATDIPYNSNTNCIPAGPNRINRGATPGSNGGTLLGMSYDGLHPCPTARLALTALSVERLPAGAARVTYRIEGLPEGAALRFLVTSEAFSQSLLRYEPEGSFVLRLPKPSSYQLTVEAQTSEGYRLLGRRLISYQTSHLLDNRTLHLWDEEGGPYRLYNLQGVILMEGSLSPNIPQTLSLEALPAGLYWLSIRDQPPTKVMLGVSDRP
jgi:hypothetical protein